MTTSHTKTILAGLVASLAFSGVARPAILADHLKCYKVKDTAAKASYTADFINGIGAEFNQSGCTIKVPAKMLCTAVEKAATPTPPGPSVFGIQFGTQLFACYKLKCPKVSGELTIDDQFGSRTSGFTNTKLLCAPANVPPPG
jgi:hypothetical protein